MEMGARSIPYIGWVVSLIITGPIELGAAMYFLALTRGGKPDIEMVFGGFRDFGRSLGACVLMGLFVFLWALLLIIPGIIAALAYSQTYYLLVDYPELGAMDAITRSREMMRGHKGRLFCLHLRFFLWGLLCILTLGIGFIWLAPYMRVTFARFYDDLREPAPVHDFVPEMPPGPAV
jgi:uncharacterized membrane protein